MHNLLAKARYKASNERYVPGQISMVVQMGSDNTSKNAAQDSVHRVSIVYKDDMFIQESFPAQTLLDNQSEIHF